MLRSTPIFRIWMVSAMNNVGNQRILHVGTVPFVMQDVNHDLLEELCREEEQRTLKDLESFDEDKKEQERR